MQKFMPQTFIVSPSHTYSKSFALYNPVELSKSDILQLKISWI